MYASLAAEARREPDAELVRWLTERECAEGCGAVGPWAQSSVRPDGWGIWREGGERVEFFLEYDRGTEALARLAAKLGGYESLEGERGVGAWVLFAFESARREASARRALAGATVAVATAALDGTTPPSAAVWLPLRTHTAARFRLASLARVPLPAEALARTEGRRSWRYAAFYGDDGPQPVPAASPDRWLDEDEDGEPW